MVSHVGKLLITSPSMGVWQNVNEETFDEFKSFVLGRLTSTERMLYNL